MVTREPSETAHCVSSTEDRTWAEQVVRGRGEGVLFWAVFAVRRRLAQEELQQVMTVHDSERSSRSTSV
jgi:hypothetical protein